MKLREMKITWPDGFTFLKRKSIIRNIFTRFIVVLLLSILPSIAIASYSKYLMTGNEKKSNTNYLTAVSSAFDNTLFRIRDKGNSIISANRLCDLLVKNDKYGGGFVLASNEILISLSRLYTYDNVIDDSFIYFKNLHLLISSTGTAT